MVEAGGGGLDPLEAAVVADFVPIDGDFGVAAEDVGGGELGGDVFLAGVDDLVTGGGGPDLGKVTRLDRVAEDEALFGRWRIGIAWHTIGCCQRSPVLARATWGGHCPPKVNAFKKLVGGAHPTRLSLRIRGSFSLASAARESRGSLVSRIQIDDRSSPNSRKFRRVCLGGAAARHWLAFLWRGDEKAAVRSAVRRISDGVFGG